MFELVASCSGTKKVLTRTLYRCDAYRVSTAAERLNIKVVVQRVRDGKDYHAVQIAFLIGMWFHHYGKCKKESSKRCRDNCSLTCFQ